MPAYIGTSGWQYRHWRDRYYRDVPGDEWLERYARDFATVELNASFYRLPAAKTFGAWAARTPPDFVFAVKASRYLTHVRRLHDPVEPVERLMEAAANLGPKLGPILLQLPPDFECDLGLLDAALAAFPAGVRVAVEFRHRSWFRPEASAILTDHDAALCLADRDGGRTAVVRTAGWTYLRLHSGLAMPRPCYEEAAIEGWGRDLLDLWPADADAFVYFNNDPEGCAVRDAARAARLFSRLGLPATRAPEPDSIRVG